MSALETKVPPPLVALLAAVVMIVGTGGVHVPAWPLLAAALAVWAAAVGVWAAGITAFRRAQTTLDPFNPQQASTLVSTGIFRVSRNPIYLAMTTVLLGLALFQANPWALLGPLAFALYITFFQIVPEERALAAKFGAAYAQYRARVRRWL